jgi:hypothetical protein
LPRLRNEVSELRRAPFRSEVELSGFERRCVTWVAAWETHLVATLAALMCRSYAAGARERNCNDADREQVS